MCGHPPASSHRSPAERLSALLKEKADIHASPVVLRLLFAAHWGKVSALAHAVHDEVKAEGQS